MLVFEKNYTIPNNKISELDISKINNFVSVSGFIESQNLKGENLFVNFCSDLNLYKIKNKSNCIKLILFKIDEKLEENIEYSVIGKITYYNNELEIIVRKIEIK